MIEENKIRIFFPSYKKKKVESSFTKRKRILFGSGNRGLVKVTFTTYKEKRENVFWIHIHSYVFGKFGIWKWAKKKKKPQGRFWIGLKTKVEFRNIENISFINEFGFACRYCMKWNLLLCIFQTLLNGCLGQFQSRNVRSLSR